MAQQQHPTVGHQGNADDGVVPARPSAQLDVSPGEHRDPHHPDAAGEQEREEDEHGLSPPLLVGGPCVAVAVCAAGAAQQVHGQEQADRQEAQHVDLHHGKFLLAVLARFLIPDQDDDQPLGRNDNLHGEEPQSHGGLPPAPSSRKAQQGETASQQAGEGQGEEHGEEEDPGGAGLRGEADDEGKGDGEDPGCGQQVHGHADDCAADAAALVPG